MCRKCRKRKALTNFYKAACKDGRGYTCKPCHINMGRLWRKRNPSRYKRNARALHARTKYNLTLEEYDKLLATPCWICKHPKSVVDHCHKRGFVRGPLCKTCNTGIGMLQDNPELCVRAARYLRKHQRRVT